MARKVVTRSPHREVGVVNAGWLLDHAVEHESHLERRFVMAALSCPVIQDIVHQPFTLSLESEANGSGDKRYTPDFKVTFRDGTSLFVEVKPEVFIQKHAERLRLIERCMRRDGLRFFIANEVAHRWQRAKRPSDAAHALRPLALLRRGGFGLPECDA